MVGENNRKGGNKGLNGGKGQQQAYYAIKGGGEAVGEKGLGVGWNA